MRANALAAATAALALMTGIADARPWADPAGRLAFDAPAGWSVNQPPGSPEGVTYVMAGNANNECQFLAINNPATATSRVNHVRTQSGEAARFTNDVWSRTLNQFPELVRSGAIQVQSMSVETPGFWPIQRAEARAGELPVHAAIQVRPGVEIFAACVTYGGADPIETYNQVIRSVGHPNDAAFQASAAAEAAPAPAAQ